MIYYEFLRSPDSCMTSEVVSKNNTYVYAYHMSSDGAGKMSS